MEINKHSLPDYLFQETTLFTSEKPLIVTPLSNEQDKYVDGYVNYLYSLRQDQQKFILKHSKQTLSSGISLTPIDPKRNYLEYLTYQLRSGLVPQMVPATYFADQAMHLFIMEDLSYLKVLRFSLCHGQQLPLLGKQTGEFLARIHLATSQFNLTKGQWDNLVIHFQNSDMHKIVTDFILKPPLKISNGSFDQVGLQDILTVILQDSVLKNDWNQLIEKISDKQECLIHGDFHSSNIFVSATSFKVIDMEYTMTGPFSYDIGYFSANILSQYAAFTLKNESSMCIFLLQVIKDLYQTYFKFFSNCIASNQKEYLIDIFQDSLGYLAIANINRITSLGEFPDFDCLKSDKDCFLAKGLSLYLAQILLKKRKKLTTIEEVCSLITQSTHRFFQQVFPINQTALLDRNEE